MAKQKRLSRKKLVKALMQAESDLSDAERKLEEIERTESVYVTALEHRLAQIDPTFATEPSELPEDDGYFHITFVDNTGRNKGGRFKVEPGGGVLLPFNQWGWMESIHAMVLLTPKAHLVNTDTNQILSFKFGSELPKRDIVSEPRLRPDR